MPISLACEPRPENDLSKPGVERRSNDSGGRRVSLALRNVGLSLDEIAAVLDDEQATLVDTVRRHVAAVERDIERRRRLLERLREMLDTLERSSRPSVDELIGTVEAMSVVEATIEDVVTREPSELLWETQPPIVVLLREVHGDRVLPIWIGQPEAAALEMQRRGIEVARPMTYDMTTALLDALDGRVERVVIERLEDNTFYATLVVARAGEPREVDARPSDALNIALRTGAAIHVASELIDTATLAHGPLAPGEPVDGVSEPPWVPLGESRRRHPAPRFVAGLGSPRVVRLAAEQARALGHGAVRAPHLMLGVLADPASPAAALLARHGLTLDAARAATAEHGEPPVPPPDDEEEPLPLSPRAVVMMQRAAWSARKRGTLDITPLDVLRALVDMPDADAFAGVAGLDLDALRAEVRAASAP